MERRNEDIERAGVEESPDVERQSIPDEQAEAESFLTGETPSDEAPSEGISEPPPAG